MYTSHFQFKAKPFQICTDPKFLWLGEQHKKALAILLHGIRENKGVIALSGGVGTGKTTLINTVLDQIKDDVIAAVVPDPGLKPIEFFNYLANLYGITDRVNSKKDFLLHFEALLKDAYQQKKRVLLVIDEAQRLNASLLEEIRLLSSIDQSGRRLLNVFLVGQNELKMMLLKPENRYLKQCIATSFSIAPLALDEVHAYIEYRLKVAGCNQRIFTKGAITEIFAFSEGYPRLINAICNQSLLGAFAEDKRKVTARMAATSGEELVIPNLMPSHPVFSDKVACPPPEEPLISPSVRSKPENPKTQNRATHKKEQKAFPHFRWAYIGSAMALFICTGYLIYQYRSGLPPENTQTRQTLYRQAKVLQFPTQNKVHKSEPINLKLGNATVPSQSPQERLAALNVATDTPSILEKSSRKSSIMTERFIVPNNPGGESSSAEEAEASTVPKPKRAADKSSPKATVPGDNGSSVSTASAGPLPASSGDKDPGAIIDWLIQKKNRKPEE